MKRSLIAAALALSAALLAAQHSAKEISAKALYSSSAGDSIDYIKK